MNTKIKQTQKEDWWLFCDNYLKIAELGCREMICQRYHGWWSDKKGDTGPKRFWIYNLYISTVYNLKHSIEIFLKYFLIVIENEFPEYKKDGHNIEKYLELFKSKHKVDIINKKIKKAYKEKLKSRYSLEVASLATDFHDEWIENIARISLKYFNCEDIKGKISNFKLRDEKNDGFRYPKNKLAIEINYSELIHKITKEDIKLILKDIGELENAFNSLRFLIEAYYDLEKNKI